MTSRTVEITKVLTVTIEPFAVPNYVATVEKDAPNLKLSEVPPEVIIAMCDEWRDRVLFLAGAHKGNGE